MSSNKSIKDWRLYIWLCQRKNWQLIANIATIVGVSIGVIGLIWAVRTYRAAKEQTDVFHNLNLLLNVKSINDLGDRCYWYPSGGDRSTFEILKSMVDQEKGIKGKGLRDAIINQLRRVERDYKSSTLTYGIETQPAVCKKSMTECDPILRHHFEPLEGFDTVNVYQHLGYPEWTSRARAALLLRNIDTSDNKNDVSRDEIHQKLIDLMQEQNETSLCVSKIAFETYKSLTGFTSKEVFGFKKATEDWNKRRIGRNN